MELLELQARARAIRSQLALEPITKIELDSDNSSSSSSSSSGSSSESESEKSKKKKTVTEKTKEATVTEKNNGGNIVQPPVRIRLKRNFRQRQPDDEDNDGGGGAKETNPIEEKTKEKTPEPDRCSSPEVVTFVKSPETYCISDSDDEPTKPEEIVEPPPKEDPEEGEIVDEEEEEEQKVEEIVLKIEEPEEIVEKETEDVDKEEQVPEETSVEIEELEKSVESEEVVPTVMKDVKPSSEAVITNADDSVIDLDCEEDTLTVDLDKEELDYEMKGTDSEDESTTVSTSTKIVEPTDIVEINNSSNDESEETPPNDTRSFHERWLDSKKVSKILATSRLGNRVRDKIKLRKIQSAQTELENKEKDTRSPSSSSSLNELKSSGSAGGDDSNTSADSTKFEEGSVQQYQEILANEKE